MGKLERFLSQFGKNTCRSYKLGLNKFFQTVDPQPSPLTLKAENYLNEKRDYEGDILNFNQSIANLPPKSSGLYITAVKMFLMEYGIELPNGFWKKLQRRRKGRSKALTLDKVLSKVELKKLIDLMPLNGKALYSLMLSSGMRIGEALELMPSDIDFENRMIKLRAEITKTHEPRITFFTEEAKNYVLDWMRYKPEYMKKAVARSARYPKKLEDDRLFPFVPQVAYQIWKTALSKTGNGERDPTTKRLRVHPHTLRKYFRAMLSTVISVDVVEALMGHSGYLTEVYRKYPDPEKTLKELYQSGEHTLIIGETLDQIRMKTLEEQLREKSLIIEALKTREKGKEEEIQTLKAQLQALQSQQNTLSLMMEEAKPYIDRAKMVAVIDALGPEAIDKLTDEILQRIEKKKK